MTYGEAIELINGLRMEMGSHLATELEGFSRPTSMTEIALLTLANAYLTVHTAEGQKAPEGLPMPWVSEEEKASEVAPDEKARLLAVLEARAAEAFQTE